MGEGRAFLMWTRPWTLLLLAACALARGAGAETAEGVGAASPPVLAGCEIDYPPYCIATESGHADGFSAELLRAAANAVGHEVTFKTGVWEKLKRDLAEGRIQALPLVGRTPEREALYDFTFPYLTMHGTIVVRNDNTDIRGPEDLKGKDVAVLKGDNAEEYLNRARLGARIVPLQSFETALRELSAGKHEAVVIQKLVAFQLMKSARIENLKTVGKPIGDFSQSFCFAVRKGDRDLLASLNEGLAIVMADGTFRRLYTKWFAALEALGRTKSRIVVGGDNDYPPYEFLDRNGQPAGFNVDLTRAIARQLGIDVDIRLAAWGKIRKGMQTGDIDLVQGMFYSVERDKAFDFSPPHTVVAHTIVVRKGSPVPADMTDLSGKSILVMVGDVMEDLAVEMGLGKQLVAVASQEEALGLLAAGKHDCALVASVPALYWIEKRGWRNLQLGEKPVLSAEYCYAAPQGNRGLLSQLAEGLAALEKTGELWRIRTRWLGPYEASKTSLQTVARYVLAAILPLLALLLGSVLWSRSLRKQVVMRTRELSLKSALLQAQSEASPDGILAMDPEGRMLMLNERFAELWATSGEKQTAMAERGVPEMVLRALRDPEELRAKVEYLRDHPAATSQDDVELKDGRVFDRHSRPLTGSKGAVLGRVWYFRDITGRKEAEEKIRALNAELEGRVVARTAELQAALREMEAFSYSVSHDLRAPLRAVDGYAAMLAKACGPKLNGDERRFLDVVRESAQRMARLIDDLLAFSRTGRSEIRSSRVDMRAMARAVFDEITPDPAARERIAFTMGDLPEAWGDQTLLRQVWTNLLANAVKFSSGTEGATIEVTGAVEGDSVVYQVRDNGAGFDMAYADKLFGVFQRLHGVKEFEGTGIGLALVKRIVERHGGRIWAEGAVGKGATFWFTLGTAFPPSSASATERP